MSCKETTDFQPICNWLLFAHRANIPFESNPAHFVPMELQAGYLRVLKTEADNDNDPDVSIFSTANFGFPLSGLSSESGVYRGQYQLGATFGAAIHYGVLRMATPHASQHGFNILRVSAGAGLTPFYNFGHGESSQGGIAPEIFGDFAFLNLIGVHASLKGVHTGFFGTPAFGLGARLAIPL